VKKKILLYNFSNLQSEGLFLLFERTQKFNVELLPIQSEIESGKFEFKQELESDSDLNDDLESEKVIEIKKEDVVLYKIENQVKIDVSLQNIMI
jgi:hypothetical protein